MNNYKHTLLRATSCTFVLFYNSTENIHTAISKLLYCQRSCPSEK